MIEDLQDQCMFIINFLKYIIIYLIIYFTIIYSLIETKTTSLENRLHTDDKLFLDFMTRLLRIDPSER